MEDIENQIVTNKLSTGLMAEMGYTASKQKPSDLPTPTKKPFVKIAGFSHIEPKGIPPLPKAIERKGRSSEPMSKLQRSKQRIRSRQDHSTEVHSNTSLPSIHKQLN